MAYTVFFALPLATATLQLARASQLQRAAPRKKLCIKTCPKLSYIIEVMVAAAQGQRTAKAVGHNCYYAK